MINLTNIVHFVQLYLSLIFYNSYFIFFAKLNIFTTEITCMYLLDSLLQDSDNPLQILIG